MRGHEIEPAHDMPLAMFIPDWGQLGARVELSVADPNKFGRRAQRVWLQRFESEEAMSDFYDFVLGYEASWDFMATLARRRGEGALTNLLRRLGAPIERVDQQDDES